MKRLRVDKEQEEEILTLNNKISELMEQSHILQRVMTDLLGRSYSHNESITIMPIVDFAFTMPSEVHYGKTFEVAISKSQHTEKADVVWTLIKDGESCSYVGELSKDGGTIAINDIGEFTLTTVVTDSLGRECRYSQSITLTNALPVISEVKAV